VARPPSAEPLGHRLGLSVLTAVKQIPTHADGELKIVNETISLPRGTDLERRIAAIHAEQAELLRSLQPTDINFKTFLPLFVQHKISPEFPSFYSQGYAQEDCDCIVAPEWQALFEAKALEILRKL